MEPRQENRNRDDNLDARIDHLVSRQSEERAPGTTAEQVAHEFDRLTSEESPRLSNAARAQGLNTLRARAAQKRAQRRPNPFAFLLAVPRWAQIAAVAIVVVVVANGVTTAAADALPGSLLYPFKRFGEGGQLLLQNTNGQRARLWMNLAATRLDEVQGMLRTGGQVDPTALDAVDESILRALSELSGTRGEERVQLLQQLLALSVRQQQIVNELAQNASPTDRTRYEQTAKLLQGIASYAQSPDAVLGVEGNPFQFLTPTPTGTATETPTVTATPLPTQTVTPLPTATLPVPTQPAPTQPVNANDNSNGNSIGNNNDNGSNDNGGNGNGNDNGVDDNGNDNGSDDNGGGKGNDNGGDDNGNDNGSDDDGGDDSSGSGNDNAGDDHSGSGNGNDNGGDDNSGGGNDNGGNDNGGGGNDNGGDDNGGGGGNDNGGDDHGDGNDNGGENDNGGGGNDNEDNDNGGGHGGGGHDDNENENDNGDLIS